MWELDYKESWTLKNWCFWTVVLEKTFESPLDSRRSIQSILKKTSPEYSLEGLMLKLKLQYFSHILWRNDQPRQHIKSRDITLPTKVHLVKSYGFSSSHVWMWELDYKESWAPKNWGFWIVVLEKTLESPLDCKEIQTIHPKGNQSWIFIGRTDAEVETPILWPPDRKS